MKKITIMLTVLLTALGLNAAKINVSQIEPTYWFVGMKNCELQLMVYGQGIANANATIDYPGVTIKETVRPGSQNYLLLYLNVAPETKAGTMLITFNEGKSKKSVKYELRERTMKGSERKGFDASDALYLLMPDRFCNGRPETDIIKGMADERCDRTKEGLRHGGDLEGIRQHLDYFTDLGVTALWFTPVLENDMEAGEGLHSSYHGYATTNYYKVDPRFGTNEEYASLIEECHKRGLKMVMDMIFNHCGSNHPWALDPPSKDWFNRPDYGLQTSYVLTPIVDPYASDVDKAETQEGWFVKTMPDLNQNNRHVMRYLVQNSKWWVETAGIDGIRMDTYPYAYFDAMAEWAKELNEEYPNYNIVGETWVTEPAYTATWQKDSRLSQRNSNLKSVMDFSFYDKITAAAGEESKGMFDGLNRIYNNFVYDYLYPNPLSVMAFIGNHDTDRYIKNGNNVPMLKQALTILLTTRRIPQLYYGDEVLMKGTKEKGDGNVRCDFPGGWKGDTHNCFTREGRTAEENDMFDYASRLLHWRQGNEAISKGDMKQFRPHGGVYVYTRSYGGRTVLVILNGSEKENTFTPERYAEVIKNHTSGCDIISDKRIDLTKPTTLAPRQNIIIDLEK